MKSNIEKFNEETNGLFKQSRGKKKGEVELTYKNCICQFVDDDAWKISFDKGSTWDWAKFPSGLNKIRSEVLPVIEETSKIKEES